MLPSTLLRFGLLVAAGIAVRLLFITTESPAEGILGMTVGLVVLGQMFKK